MMKAIKEPYFLIFKTVQIRFRLSQTLPKKTIKKEGFLITL